VNPEDIRLLDGHFYAGDPYPAYAWLREHSPVHWDARHRVWGISRFADVVAIEKDPKRYSSAAGSRPRIPGDPAMINTDDPHHNRRRRLVSPRFTPRAVRRHEAEIRGYVRALVDGIARRGEAEIVEEVAAPLPAMVINRWLGFPHEMWRKCKHWSEVTMLAGGQHAEDGSIDFGSVEGAPEAVAEFAQEVLALAALRRRAPQDDLVSVWANATEDGRPLDDASIVAEALLVLDGGAETTRAVIAATLIHLTTNPDERARLVADPGPGPMKVAVEEFIRYVTPILNMRRTATGTHELHGQTICEGDELLLMYGSANRDPAQFDDPERFDVRRERNQHLAFGFGTHFCLGASVARLELRLLFEQLLRRLPDISVAPGFEPRFVPSCFTRAPEAVQVAFTPER
jgi:cytochrome P450 family 142 subfamily A polypeptide 1